MMIFKPSKSGGYLLSFSLSIHRTRVNVFKSDYKIIELFHTIPGNKGRAVGQRTASVVLNKSKPGGGGNTRPKIQADPPVLEASASVDLVQEETLIEEEEEASRGRASSVSGGGGGRIKPSRPRPIPSEVSIEGSMITFEEPSARPPLRSKTSLTERLKATRPKSDSPDSIGSGSVVSSYSLIKSHVDVSSRVDIRIGGLPKVSLIFGFNLIQSIPSQSTRELIQTKVKSK